MPTTRSLYTFEQFKQVFQKIAHEEAIEAVTDLKPVRIIVKTFSSGELSEVETADYHFRFYFSHFSLCYRPGGSYDHPDYMSFDVEEKYYSTSRDCTKISFFVKEEYDEDEAKKEAKNKKKRAAAAKKIHAFIEKLMKEAGLKPEPRFSLKKYSSK